MEQRLNNSKINKNIDRPNINKIAIEEIITNINLDKRESEHIFRESKNILNPLIKKKENSKKILNSSFDEDYSKNDKSHLSEDDIINNNNDNNSEISFENRNIIINKKDKKLNINNSNNNNINSNNNDNLILFKN